MGLSDSLTSVSFMSSTATNQLITWTSCWPGWQHYRDNIFIRKNCSWTISPVQKVQTDCLSKWGIQGFSLFFLVGEGRTVEELWLNLGNAQCLLMFEFLSMPFLHYNISQAVQEFCSKGTSRSSISFSLSCLGSWNCDWQPIQEAIQYSAIKDIFPHIDMKSSKHAGTSCREWGGSKLTFK